MKRLLSIILVVSMLFGMIQVPVMASGEPGNSSERYDDCDFGNEGPGNNSERDDDSDFGEGPGNNPIREDDGDFDEGPSDMSTGNNQDGEETFEEWDIGITGGNGPADMNSAKNTECEHNRTKKLYHETKYEKYNSEKHSYKETYEVICKDCGKVLSSKKTESGLEAHYFRKGKCADCEYVIKNCKHKETVEEVTYWRTEEDDRGNDKSFTVVDVLCKVCGEKITEKTYYGPIIAVPEDYWCDHDDVKEIVEEEYYEPLDENAHYKIQKCKVKCDECGLLLKEYKTEETEEHSIISSKCTKCIYENKNTSAQGNDKTGNKETNKKPKNDAQENEEPIEWIYIDAEQSKFAVDGIPVSWNSAPILDANGNLQVPLRQLAEIMGWKVTWNEEKGHAVVTAGDFTKTFMLGFDIYQVKNEDEMYYQNLQNKVQIINGSLYVDLDGVLDCTGYSYYVNGTSYHIKSIAEVINKVVYSNVYENYDVVASKTIVDDVNSIVEVSKDEVLVSLIPTREGWYYTVMVPAANQALKGNYYDGDFKWEGLVGEILVGELPIVGTIADMRDIIADIQNWEWSWMHIAQTAIDVVGLVPIIGSLKYSDEFLSTARKTGKALDAGDVTEINKFLKHTDNIDDVTDAGKRVLKHSSRYVQSVKDSIKNVNDLKSMTKYPEIFTDDAIEHVFLGNSKGGFHYNGLSISKGKILNVASPPKSNGVYEAFVEINGKQAKKAKTFFPDDWLPEEVIGAAEEAFYKGKIGNTANQIIYTTESGLKVCLNLNKAGKITSWFPKY